MPPIAHTILSALTIAAGVIGTLTILGFTLAGSPNASPELLRNLKRFMIGTSIGGLICLIVGIVLLAKGLPGWAALVGGFPVLFIIGAIIWVMISG